MPTFPLMYLLLLVHLFFNLFVLTAQFLTRECFGITHQVSVCFITQFLWCRVIPSIMLFLQTYICLSLLRLGCYAPPQFTQPKWFQEVVPLLSAMQQVCITFLSSLSYRHLVSLEGIGSGGIIPLSHVSNLCFMLALDHTLYSLILFTPQSTYVSESFYICMV